MRLLNAKSLEFEEFEGDHVPEYAILSHTWANEEVTYKEMRKRRTEAKGKRGYDKIRHCAYLTNQHGLEYFWIDTCCINKSSSAELSEAINSMFEWYQNAVMCFAYLIDVSPQRTATSYHTDGLVSEADWASEFKFSRWFTRGWTLQELIAPRVLAFYSADWTFIGDKVSLRDHITDHTMIPHEVLSSGDFQNTSLAQRMSWASSRSTTRMEDMAYCLMGLFEVHMPLLYGEGKRAFIRLQEEIIKRSDDMSIFGWTDPNAHFSSYRGLFAESPKNFADCHQMEWIRHKKNPPYELTNKGIKLNVEMELIETSRFLALGEISHEFMMKLNGVSIPESNTVSVRLQALGDDEYARVEAHSLLKNQGHRFRSELEGSPQTIFVRQNPTMQKGNHSRVSGIRVTTGINIQLLDASPEHRWDASADGIAFTEAPYDGYPSPTHFAFALVRTGEAFDITVTMSRKWGSCIGTDISPVDVTRSKVTSREHLLELKIRPHTVTVSLRRTIVKGTACVILEVR